MNYNIDWGEFLKSAFCLKALVEFDINTNVSKFRDDGVIQFDTTLYDSDNIRSLHNQVLPKDIGESRSIWPSLWYSLIATHSLDIGIIRLIERQWSSVLNVIEQLKYKPFRGFLLIMPPGSSVYKHKHASYIKEALTFQFNFPEYVDNTLPKSAVRVYDSKTDDIRYLKSSTNKTLFTLKDDIIHDCFCNNLRFLWVNFFTEHIDLKNIDLGDFELGTFEPVKK
jgi:hypothetical protein